MKLWCKLGLPQPKSEASTGPLSLVDNEIYSGIEVPNMPHFVRLDGWRFHTLAKELRLKKPFDEDFANCMVTTAKAFFKYFNPTFAYIFSDEINLLFLKNPTFRRVEKIDSVFAGYASSIFFSELGKKLKRDLAEYAFDCRVIPVTKREILKYLIWRQAEAFRNFNNSVAQFALMRAGFSARAAAKKLEGLKVKQLHALVKKHGVDLAKIPKWQIGGVIVYKRPQIKIGYNPLKKAKVKVLRMKIIEDWSPPHFARKDGATIVAKILKSSEN